MWTWKDIVALISCLSLAGIGLANLWITFGWWAAVAAATLIPLFILGASG